MYCILKCLFYYCFDKKLIKIRFLNIEDFQHTEQCLNSFKIDFNKFKTKSKS